MHAPRIVSALRAREPDALGELFDAHGEELFHYCWLMAHSRDAALVAVRDAMIVAQAHIERLRDPGQLRPWLYALARVECRRHMLAAPEDADQAPGAADGESRLMAWSAVMSLPPAEREVLDLTARCGMSARDAGLVTGLGADAAALVDQARASLQQAMSTEVAARRPGVVPGRVSPARVYERLPWPPPPPGMRAEILACFGDERQARYLALAVSQVPPLDSAGFPVSAERQVAPPPEPRVSPEAAVLPEAALPPEWAVPLRLASPSEPAPPLESALLAEPAGLSELFSRTGPVRARSRRLAAGLIAAAIATGAAAALAVAGLSLPGGTSSAGSSARPVANAAGESIANAGPGGAGTEPVVAPPAGVIRRAGTARLSRHLLGPGPGTGTAAVLYLNASQPQGGRGGQAGTAPGGSAASQPGSTPVLPPHSGGSPAPSASGTSSPSGSASPSPPPSTTTPPSGSGSPSPGSPPASITSPPLISPSPTPSSASPSASDSSGSSASPSASDSPGSSASPSASGSSGSSASQTPAGSGSPAS
jgi:DNA-directed RNA polymerase specialized sigma24 family protein